MFKRLAKMLTSGGGEEMCECAYRLLFLRSNFHYNSGCVGKWDVLHVAMLS